MNNDRPFSMLRTYLFFTPLLLSLAVSADGKSIGKDQVNIREHPNLKSAVLFTAPLGYPIEIKKKNGEWLFFNDWQDNSGWVYKSLVSDIDTAVVLVDRANIRNAPRLDASVMANAEQGEIYTIIARDNNWVKLGYYQSGTALGWIRDDLVFGE